MSPAWITAGVDAGLWISGGVGLIIAAGGWVVAIAVRREQSRVEVISKGGTIRSSEASDLWAEGEKIREYLTTQLEKRDARLGQLATEVDLCRESCEERRQETEACERREKALMEAMGVQAASLADALARLEKGGL